MSRKEFNCTEGRGPKKTQTKTSTCKVLAKKSAETEKKNCKEQNIREDTPRGRRKGKKEKIPKKNKKNKKKATEKSFKNFLIFQSFPLLMVL